jgi:phage-related protein
MGDNQTITWVDTNSTEFPLTGDFKVLAGLNGFYMPPISVIDEEVPFQAGSMLRNVKVGARELDVPLRISGATSADLDRNLRRLLRTFNPLKGDGKFIVTSTDGTVREINCRYISGFGMEESVSSRSAKWQRAVGVFRAFDPYWYDTATQVQTFKINESPGTFFPVFPLALASSTVFASVAINNEGDVDTWPEWEINGPCQGVVLRNLSTGEVLGLDVTLELGESITIDTKPFRKLVVKNDSTNLFYTMSSDSSLWALQEGINGIQIEMGGATLDSSAQLTYRNRYWGP